MNIFSRIASHDFEGLTALGRPLRDDAAIGRRVNEFATMTGGRGFRVPEKGPKLSKGGKTRRERKASRMDVYLRNLEAEAVFREEHADWSIARIRDAIERGEHLRR